MKNVILIGMPGAGKSTIGVVLAKTLGMEFFDTDLEIQKREKRLLQSIIDKDGLDGFLKIEERTVLACSFDNQVVATGGSVVKSIQAMHHLRKQGSVFYLELDYITLENRVGNIKTRGIVMKKGQSLKDVFDERVPLYERFSDYTIDCRDKNPEDIVSLICYHVRGE